MPLMYSRENTLVNVTRGAGWWGWESFLEFTGGGDGREKAQRGTIKARHLNKKDFVLTR